MNHRLLASLVTVVLLAGCSSGADEPSESATQLPADPCNFSSPDHMSTCLTEEFASVLDPATVQADVLARTCAADLSPDAAIMARSLYYFLPDSLVPEDCRALVGAQ